MKKSLENKFNSLLERHEEIKLLLSDPDIVNQAEQFRELSKEYASLTQITEQYHAYLQISQALKNTEALLVTEQEAALIEMVKQEIELLKTNQKNTEKRLKILLLPEDKNDKNNVFLEIRGAAGGHESAIFAGDLFRMYAKYAEKNHWQIEILQASEGEQGGYKIIVARIIGSDVYARLKFESGAHRVQRVPETEAQGRVHTSTCTVAILPEIEAISDVDINPADLKIDTFRASGAGGQHVNKTESAIRITHLPTGTIVECQDERSQHKNRARAMSLLKARLLNAEVSKQKKQITETRRSLVGTGDRSERIRTYNFGQGRMTDHRINLTVYKLNDIMQGDLDIVITPLRQEYQAELLADMTNEY